MSHLPQACPHTGTCIHVDLTHTCTRTTHTHIPHSPHTHIYCSSESIWNLQQNFLRFVLSHLRAIPTSYLLSEVAFSVTMKVPLAMPTLDGIACCSSPSSSMLKRPWQVRAGWEAEATEVHFLAVLETGSSCFCLRPGFDLQAAALPVCHMAFTVHLLFLGVLSEGHWSGWTSAHLCNLIWPSLAFERFCLKILIFKGIEAPAWGTGRVGTIGF